MDISLIKRFVRPDRRKIVISVVLLIILWGGQTQAWVFSDKDMGVPKPFLYDLIEPLPFWVISVLLFAPIGMLGNFIDAVFGYNPDLFLRQPFWGWGTNLLYTYVLSCIIVHIWDVIRGDRKKNGNQEGITAND
jgi:hypothetical protein